MLPMELFTSWPLRANISFAFRGHLWRSTNNFLTTVITVPGNPRITSWHPSLLPATPHTYGIYPTRQATGEIVIIDLGRSTPVDSRCSGAY